MARKNKTSTKLGKALIESLGEAVAWKAGRVDLRTEEIELPDDPPALSAEAVRGIRHKMKVSQPEFAKFLGVTDKAVKAWEQGRSKPNGAAVRLLQLARKEPKKFPQLILKSSK